MTRYFMQSWKSHLCEEYVRRKDEGELLCETSSARFGVCARRDQIYAVFVSDGRLYLVGKMQVGRKTSSRKEVAALGGRENVYPGVRGATYLIAELATPMHFKRPVPLRVVRMLRFVSRAKPTLKFVDDEKLDRQTLRSVRELTPKSAALLDEFLESMKPVDLDSGND